MWPGVTSTANITFMYHGYCVGVLPLQPLGSNESIYSQLGSIYRHWVLAGVS